MLRNVGEHLSGKIGNVVFVRTKDISYVIRAPDCSKVVWSDQQNNYRKRTSKIGVKEQFTYPLETFMERETEVGTTLFPDAEMMQTPTHVFLFWVSDEHTSYSNSMGFVIPDLPV